MQLVGGWCSSELTWVPHPDEASAHERRAAHCPALGGGDLKRQVTYCASRFRSEASQEAVERRDLSREAPQKQLVSTFCHTALREAGIRKRGLPTQHGCLVGVVLGHLTVDQGRAPVGSLHSETIRHAGKQ
jgi:hypothetical protein